MSNVRIIKLHSICKEPSLLGLAAFFLTVLFFYFLGTAAILRMGQKSPFLQRSKY